VLGFTLGSGILVNGKLGVGEEKKIKNTDIKFAAKTMNVLKSQQQHD